MFRKTYALLDISPVFQRTSRHLTFDQGLDKRDIKNFVRKNPAGVRGRKNTFTLSACLQTTKSSVTQLTLAPQMG
jgi:hypothetical protein